MGKKSKKTMDEGRVPGRKGRALMGTGMVRGLVRGMTVPGGHLGSFGLGIAAAAVAGAAVPGLGRSLRPLGKTLVKAGLRAGEGIARQVAIGKENLEDLVAEARAEYDAERAGEEEAAPESPAGAAETA